MRSLHIPTLLVIAMSLGLCNCSCTGTRKQTVLLPPPTKFHEEVLPVGARSYHVTSTHGGKRPVILLHEINGQSPPILQLALELEQAGCKVYVPRLFGEYGHSYPPYWLHVLLSRNWSLFHPQESGRIREDLSVIAAKVRKDHPGESITVIGNCLTGMLPLELLAQEKIDLVVLCQPTLPLLSFSGKRKEAFALPEEVVARSMKAMENTPGKRIISFNYADDPFAPIQRAMALARRTKVEGREQQHELWIACDPAHPSPEPGIRHAGWNLLEAHCRKGHSTLSSPSREDRETFRRRLFQSMGLPSWRPLP